MKGLPIFYIRAPSKSMTYNHNIVGSSIEFPKGFISHWNVLQYTATLQLEGRNKFVVLVVNQMRVWGSERCL